MEPFQDGGSRVWQVSSKMCHLDDDALVSGHEAFPNNDNKDTDRKGKGTEKEGILGHRGSKAIPQCVSLVRGIPNKRPPSVCLQCSGNISVVAIAEGVPKSRRP